MKCLLMLLVLLVFIVSSTMVYALPVGNVGMPGTVKKGLIIKDENSKFGFAFGPEVDLNGDRNMKHQAKDTEYTFIGGRGGIIVSDKAYLYGIIGAADAYPINSK